MEHYIVSARKYRPSTFVNVIGQKALTAALKHAVATDRLAHAYLFCGSRGVGKTSCARIFAKTINCEHRTPQGEACNECPSCQAFNNNTSLNIIELDAASHNGIDDIKSLIEQVLVPPTQGRYRVFIIDEVHMLSSAAFNAFLKTLEEPPEYVIFILATTEKHKIIPTILSRCQIYDFNRITIQDMVEHLTYVASNENITVEPSALNVIARKADGAMRDALSIFDQVAASTMGQVTYQNTIDNLNILDNTYYTRLVEAFLADDVPTALLIYKEVREKGFDSQFFINGLAQYLRDLMVAYQPQTLCLLEASDDVRRQMAAVAAKCSPQWIYDAMDLCNTADLNFRVATNKQLLVELTLVKIAQLVAPKQSTQPQNIRPLQPAQPQPTAPQTAQPQPQQPQRPAPQAPQQQYQQPQRPSQPQYSQPQRPAQQPQRPAPQAPQRTQPLPQQPQPQQPMASFSISGARLKTDETAAESDDSSHHRAEKYSQEQFAQAWTAFIEEHPTERILVNTLKAALPKNVSECNYAITVYDQVQVQTVNEWKPEILRYLRDKLSNDTIDFEIRIHEGEIPPDLWDNQQVLQHIVEKHPQISEMIQDFGLTL